MANASAAADVSLDELSRDHRLLLLFAPYRENGSLQWQQQTVSASQGALAKRDVRVVTIVGESEGYLDSQPLSRASIAHLREAAEVPSEKFTLLLLTKGGRQLVCQTQPMKMHELLEKLDAAA